MSDAELAESAQNGDVDAFATLMRRHYATSLRFAIRMLGTRAEAEDAVQETFIRAFRSIHRYRERDRFGAWLLRILRNRCRTHISRERSRSGRVRLYADNAQTVVEPAAIEDSDGLVQQALQQLPPKLREAFILKFVEQLEYVEMERITGTSVSALKMRVKRARETLQQILGAENE
jgi:RNA polymerase sigma-70 factor (ECF subfamily)